MTDVYICDYIRTPIGRFGGALASVRADDLGAIPLRALMVRHAGLDWAAVDDVIESGYPLFARCYRDGVQRNSNLDGAVRFRFIVGESGHVTTVEDGGSDLTDRQVIDCVAEGFYALRFPEPSRGDAHLLYRIHFDAG